MIQGSALCCDTECSSPPDYQSGYLEPGRSCIPSESTHPLAIFTLVLMSEEKLEAPPGWQSSMRALKLVRFKIKTVMPLVSLRRVHTCQPRARGR